MVDIKPSNNQDRKDGTTDRWSRIWQQPPSPWPIWIKTKSVIVSMAVVMESYDLQIIPSFYAFPSFQKKYGVPIGGGEYSIPARWQVALGVASNVGLVIRIFVNGWLVDRFGHKRI